MDLAELDDLIDATPDAAMVLLTSADWRATMAVRPLVSRGPGAPDHVVYRGLPVWVVSPGPSRVLTASQVKSQGLDGL